jgi:hypothetical protein
LSFGSFYITIRLGGNAEILLRRLKNNERENSSDAQFAPSPEDVQAHPSIISHPANVPIVVTAMQTKVDYLVTLSRRHFIDDPSVAARSGLRIGTPGNGLTWVKDHLN